jgi:hypothetical protein
MLVCTKLNARNILNIAKNIFYARQHMPTPLGRWKICENKNINLMIDYANEDHCGACSHHIPENSADIRNDIRNDIQNQLEKEDDEENNIYDYDFECLLTNSNSK